MPVVRAAEDPTFDLNGSTVTSLASPSVGATDCLLYRIDVPPGADALPAHRHDHQDVFTLIEGSLTAHLDDQAHEIAPGDTVIVPTGVLHRLEAGPGGAVIVVTMLPGTLFIREDGSSSVPPWAK